MRNFNQDNRSGGRRGSGGRALYQATCAECGNSCEVPFKPSGDKPIFCSNCFQKKGNRNEDSRSSGGRHSGRSDYEEKRMFAATCDKCGNACEVPFRPTGDRPVYCKQCFGKKGSRDDRSDKNEQFNILNAKLDKILSALAPGVTQEPAPKKPKQAVTTVKKVSKLKKAAKKTAAKKKK